ncbi:NTF2 and RRM domain-containing protein [Xylaria flabelliformis]|nr:NTF2 and RRM domain-containing protein [Xylaria flabelliformis]
MASTGPTTQTDQYQPSSAAAAAPSATSDQSNSNLGKDEVAWFFVEQYYTTLSKNPEKLHLFYGKRSQFVYGQEGQSANVSVGRQTIQERIKDLDFQNCKVRVSNVDSQASFENIVIQVIGETSNKAGDPKKFVQTFVLAQQPSGYFVLNDILRFIDEEGEEEPTEQPEAEAEAPSVEVEAEAPATVEEVKEAEPVEEPSAQEQPDSLDADVVDKKLEEVNATPEEVASVNGDATPEPAAEESTATPEVSAKAAEEPVPDPDAAAQELAEETVQQPEKPKAPSPTPVASRQPSSVAAAPTPAQPPKPMTWASRLAATGPPKVNPATPLTKTAPVPTPAARPAATTAPTASPATTTSAQATETAASVPPTKEAGPEWQTAGSDSKRQNRPQSISAHPAEKEGTLGYVKYVTDKVVREDLEAALAQYGELAYFDINRQKNCAFVEFKTPAGYQAAAAANPHVVNGENIIVEPRRPKAGAYGGSNYNAGRGNMHNRGGRGGFDSGRSGSHGSRGSFGGQNRGRGGITRGRGASQAVNV